MSTPPELRPLSLVFFCRKRDPITACISKQSKRCLNIKDNSTAIYTHVGIVINKSVCASFKPKERTLDTNDTLYLWESTLSSYNPLFSELEHVKDAETGKYIFGVQIRRLSDVIDAAKKEGVSIVYTNSYAPDEFTQAQKDKIAELKLSFEKRKYNISPFSIYTAVHPNGDVTLIDESVSQDIKHGTVFSSQFVTLILQALNIVTTDGNIRARTMLPHELAVPNVSDCYEFRRQWQNRVELVTYLTATEPESTLARLRYTSMRFIGAGMTLLYNQQIRRTLLQIINRLPISGEAGQILGDVIDVAADILGSQQAASS